MVGLASKLRDFDVKSEGWRHPQQGYRNTIDIPHIATHKVYHHPHFMKMFSLPKYY